MNKITLMGRLVRDPETKYTNSQTPLAIAEFTLAVNRRFKKDGEPDADFINCKAFSKTAETIGKFCKKGQMIAIVGRLQVRTYDNQEGKKVWVTEVIVEEFHFTGGKSESGATPNDKPSTGDDYNGGFVLDESADDSDLPF